MSSWQALWAVAAGLVLLWAVLVTWLLVAGRRTGERSRPGEVLRLLPDVLRLLRRLAADRSLPRTVRFRLFLLAGYLVLPVDLVPDFVPVIGYVDDAVVVALALRSVLRCAGPDALARHWPGSEDGLRTVLRIAGLPD